MNQNIQTNRSFSYFGQKYGYYKERERKNYLRLNLYSFSTELFSCAMFLVSYLLAAVFVGKGIAEEETDGTYTGLLLDHVRHDPAKSTKNYRGNACNLLLKDLGWKIFDFIRGHERFQEVEKELKKSAEDTLNQQEEFEEGIFTE